MRELYPLFETFNTGFLDVGSGHNIYFEESGNPNGIPVIYVNGGPGGFSKPKHRQYFNPEKYRVIAYNQRGCNNSKFKKLLKNNTTKELIEDIEKLRKHLYINKWVMCGRSWGSTLVLAYAIKYPFNVKAIITGGILIGRELDDEFVYQFGANQIFPESYHKFADYFDLQENDKIYKKIKEAVYQNNLEIAYQSVMEMFKYERSISLLIQEEEEEVEPINEIYKERIVNSGKIFLHYLQNKFFISENYFLEKAESLRNIPGVIIQGRYDLISPFINAWTLHNEWPEAEFITTIAGHHGHDKENMEKILEYTDKFAELV